MITKQKYMKQTNGKNQQNENFFENIKIDTRVAERRGRGDQNQEWKRGHDQLPHINNMSKWNLTQKFKVGLISEKQLM